MRRARWLKRAAGARKRCRPSHRGRTRLRKGNGRTFKAASQPFPLSCAGLPAHPSLAGILAKAIRRRIGITMSREAELLRLADVCYSQANATLSRAVKRALREMGDNYQHEAKQLREQALSDGHYWMGLRTWGQGRLRGASNSSKEVRMKVK